MLAIGIAERCAQDTTTETKVVRSYLIALAIADVGHVFITCFVMGYERAIDIAQWNAMAWGNIGVTVSSRPCPWRAQVQLTWCLYPGTAFPVPFGIFTGPVWIRPTITFCEDGKEAIVITLLPYREFCSLSLVLQLWSTLCDSQSEPSVEFLARSLK